MKLNLAIERDTKGEILDTIYFQRAQLKRRKFIKNNFDYVGDNFAYEARSVHYNNKKRKKGIYGKASIDDVKELSEEGIETETIPWPKDNEN